MGSVHKSRGDNVVVCSELGKGATSEAGKSLFRAASVWWRCAQYFVIASCGRMPRDNRCMYRRMFVFMSVVVTLWGSVGMFVV